MFTDGTSLYTGAITASGSQMTGYAGRITVNPALLNNPADLTVYSTSPPTAAGDTTRSDFLYSQLTIATFSYSPTNRPWVDGVAVHRHDHRAICSSSSASRATPRRTATQLQQGQDVVVSTLQQKFNSTSGVNIDTEMSNLIALQNSYAANAHVMSVVQSMMNTPAAGSNCKALKMSINSIRLWRFCTRPVGTEPQQPAHQPVDAAFDRR